MIGTKKKGYTFEVLAVELLNKYVKGSSWKRVPGSGALGTFMKEPGLTSDIVGTIKSFQKNFRIEAKVGYGGATQLSLKKIWLDKIKEEALNSNSIPLMMGKFSGAREGVKVFVTMDFETFCDVMNTMADLHEEIEKDERRRLEASKTVL